MPTRVQGNSNFVGSTGATMPVTLAAAVGNKNAICGIVGWGGGASLLSVTDDKGNAYNRETTIVDSAGSYNEAAFSRTNITNGPVTITANFSGTSPTNKVIIVEEFSGMSSASSDERDGHGGQLQNTPGTGTDAITSPPVTTTVNGDLLYGACVSTATSVFASAGTGFATGVGENTVAATQTESRVQTTAAAGTAATFTQAAAARRVTFVIALKPISAIALTANNLSVGSPVLGAPAYAKNAFDLVAVFTPHGPTFTTPAFVQKQKLVGANLTVGRPFIQIPGLTGLTAANLTVGRPQVGPAPILTHPWGIHEPIPTMSAQLDEAEDILNLVLDGLIKSVPTRIGGGRPAWDFRRKVGIVRADGKQMIFLGTLGTPLVQAFGFATAAGATLEAYERLRQLIIAQEPFSLPAQATAHLALQGTLAQMSFIAAKTVYKSRDEAFTALKRISEAYAPAEEDVADEADPMMYRALVAARAASVRDLAERGRQLPRVITYSFATPMTGLWIAHRLYDDATRFEELRDENNWIHPAFCPEEGHYLSRHDS